MKLGILTSAIISVGVIVAAPTAQAAAPKVAGKYVARIWDSCASGIVVSKDNYSSPSGTKSAVADVVVGIDGQGAVTGTIAAVSFPATASSSGNVTATMVQVTSDALLYNGSIGHKAKLTKNSQTGSFSFTATSMTIFGTEYAIVASDAIKGVTPMIIGVRKPTGSGDHCVNQIELFKAE